MPAGRNQWADTLGPTDMLQANCKLLKWNNIHDRLEMREGWTGFLTTEARRTDETDGS